MTRIHGLTLLIVVFALGCTMPAPEPLELAEQPTTADGLHQVKGDHNFTLYMAPAFVEKTRAGGYRGKGLYIRSCNVTFADADQEATFSRLRDRMADYLCESVKARLDDRGTPRIEAEAVTPETRVIDLWLLHVSLEVPDVSATSATTFVFSGASEEMTFGWVSSEAGSGLPILRYYQRGRFSHGGHYTGDGRSPNWADVRNEIDALADRALATLIPAVWEVIGRNPQDPLPE